jgi:glycosyltransferase involved in cell wall biosynthesis
MKIAVVKPDYKITGGFEIVVNKLINGLKARGYDVDQIDVDVTEPPGAIAGIPLPKFVYEFNRFFFDYVNNMSKFKNLELNDYNLIISTQPPSFAVNHPHHISYFYHHPKIYYDLHDLMKQQMKSHFKTFGHVMTARIVRFLDSKHLNKNIDFLAGSRHIKRRLNKFSKHDLNVSVCYAGIDEDFLNFNGECRFDYPICVGRHEFPKRAELFVHAMKHIPAIEGHVIGKGGLTTNLQRLDDYLAYLHYIEKNDVEDDYLWKKLIFEIDHIDLTHMNTELNNNGIRSNVVFKGEISKKTLIDEYSNALCIVCPSYEEDFGLTAVEGMAFGKTIIACDDGGGYIELIDDEKTGFIVKPNAEEIADVIEYLSENRDVAQKIGKRGMIKSKKFTWENTLDVFEEHIRLVERE